MEQKIHHQETRLGEATDATLGSTHLRGQKNEARAEAYLLSRGYIFIGRNFRWRGGEIDLIVRARTGELVFVEVRSAANESPWLRRSISRGKIGRLVRTAQTFLHRNPAWRGRPFRFDFVWVEQGRLEHWPNVELRG